MELRLTVWGALMTLFALPGLRAQAPATPEILHPPTGEHVVLHASASGDQIYACDGSKWTFVGPEAKLMDDDGREVGSHFAGPTWQWSDGSQVTGKMVANATPDAESIPWLLLAATGHKGDGVLDQVTSIQRLHTKGGKAPATGCDMSHNGDKVRSHYTADYYFYAPEGGR